MYVSAAFNFFLTTPFSLHISVHYSFSLRLLNAMIMPLQDISALRTQMSGQVDVKVDGPASLNLTGIIAQIRQDYEALIAKNRQEVEGWYNNKVRHQDTALFNIASVNYNNI